jgi:hypothetical protein
MSRFQFDVPGFRSARVSADNEEQARTILAQNVPDAVEWGAFDPTGDVVLSDVDD